MRLAALLLIFTLVAASGNPRLPDPLDIYISFERLEVTVGLTAADFRGTFKFKTAGKKSYPTQTVGLELPIWFPINPQDDSRIAAFWSVFDQPYNDGFSSKQKQTIEDLMHLKVALAGKELRPTLLMISGRGDMSRFIPKNWEVLGCRVLLFSFAVTPEEIGNGNHVTISYQQPLLGHNGERYFVYTPIFEHLPTGMTTSDTNLYSVTLNAAPTCDMTVKTGAFSSPLGAGQQITLAPQHLQVIRGVVRAAPQGQKDAANPMTYSQAVEIASRLAVGMEWSAVRKILEGSGFGKPSSIVQHHLCFFQQDPLAGGYALELGYEPTIWRTKDIILQVTTSRLQSASIRSNGIDVSSITLGNSR